MIDDNQIQEVIDKLDRIMMALETIASCVYDPIDGTNPHFIIKRK